MDAKNITNSRLADLVLKRTLVHAKGSEIPGASIVSDNLVIDMDEFGEGALVFDAYFGAEKASVSYSGSVATLDFTSAVALTDTFDIFVDTDL